MLPSQVRLPLERNLTAVRIVKADLAMKVDEEFEDQDIEEIAEGGPRAWAQMINSRTARELAPLCPPLSRTGSSMVASTARV